MANTATRTPALGDDEASRKYEEAVALLANSLGERKRLFDPTYLAFAQGILAPTQTGGFGEALGNAAKSVGTAQDAEEKRNQELLQARVTVAGQGVEMSRAKANERQVQEYLRGRNPPPEAGPLSQGVGQTSTEDSAPPPAPSVGALSLTDAPTPPALPTAPSGPLTPKATAALPAALLPPPNAPSGLQGGRQIMPPNPAYMTQDEYVRLNAGKGIPLGELLAKGAEIERHNVAKTEGAMVNLRTGKGYSIKDSIVDHPIYGPEYEGKTFKISEQAALRLSQLQMENNYAEYKKLADAATGRGFGKPTVGQAAKPVDNSVEGKAIALEREKELAKAATTQEVEDRKNFAQRARDADETITTANVFRKFAADPNAKNMFGILNNDKISSGVATLVRDGIGLPGFTVGTKAIEDVMRNANLSTADQAKYRTFLTYAAMMQLQGQKYMKGAVSDNEQKLLANSGIGPQDTPETIRTKADVLTKRAQKDRLVAKAFKNSKMTAEEFLDSDKYGEIMDKFNTEIAEIAVGLKMLVPASAKPASKNKDLDAARARVDAVLEKK
jgi:hypothetical protein